jgi:CRISPR/Cas system-associated endoribonuclease Cas2
MKQYLVAYDIFCVKRAFQVRKLVYSYTMSGQKSALEILLSKNELKELYVLLEKLLGKGDSVNILEVDDEVMLFGKADRLNYNRGVIIV